MDGFQLFDQVHIMWLIFSFTVTIIALLIYKKWNKKLFLRSVFWLLLVGELLKQLYLLYTDQYSYWSPPLHLCGLGIFIAGWYSYFQNRLNATLLFSLTLPGAAIALLFPGWTYEKVGGFIHIHSFLFHILLVIVVIAPLVNGDLNLRWQDLYVSCLFLMLIVPIIYRYNNAFETNFMFLNKPIENTPLQWLYDFNGSSLYIISLCAFTLVLWFIMYSIYFIKKHFKI